MKASRLILPLTIVFGLLASAASLAQEANQETAPALPDFSALDPNWWSYFEGSQAEITPRIELFIDRVNDQAGDLGSRNQDTAESILEAVRDNLDVYVSLFGGLEIQSESLPEIADSYSLAELLTIAARSRDARAAAGEANLEVVRERRVFGGATRRRDAVFKEDLDSAAGDDRWLAALRLVRARSALAISDRRLEILEQSSQYATAFAENAAERVELARPRTSSTAQRQWPTAR